MRSSSSQTAVRRYLVWLGFCIASVFVAGSGVTQPFPSPVVTVPKDAELKMQEAYAAFHQGQHQRAWELARQVYERYGNLVVAWYPSWLRRQVRRPLPDPYGLELGTASLGGTKVRLDQLRLRTFPVRLLFDASWKMARFDEIARWGSLLVQGGEKSPEVLRRLEYARLQLAQGWVYRVLASPPKENWRRLPPSFRTEDFFVMVAVDEAAKVLDFAYTEQPYPKGVSGKVILLSQNRDQRWALLIAHPFAYPAQGEQNRPELLAYPPFEEKGKVWVPFYWLAAKAGIPRWEVRGKHIFAPRF